MPIHRYFLSDFVTIQRQSFLNLLEKNIIEEFAKRNPITKNDFNYYFYPEYYILTRPEYTPQEAIIKNKSYTSQLFVPVQITDKKNKIVNLKWISIGNLPLMTKRGHFILNGAARVIVNQILRSPGVYYQQKIYENYEEKWSQKPKDSYIRYYADLICMRGTWLRIEMDKEKNIWAQMKKLPKIPIFWFLLAMGFSEKKILSFNSSYLIGNLTTASLGAQQQQISIKKKSLKKNIGRRPLQNKSSHSRNMKNTIIEEKNKTAKDSRKPITPIRESSLMYDPPYGGFGLNPSLRIKNFNKTGLLSRHLYPYLRNPPEAWEQIAQLFFPKNYLENNIKVKKTNFVTIGRKWFYNRFMNPRAYDLGKQGRWSFNRKLGLNITHTTLTGLDILYATDYLIKVEKGVYKIDDIDHLKNRRVRTAGELIGIQIGIGLVRLEKSIREKNFINNKAFNSAIREFFGTSPLSQFMDQINPLAEITHKRRLTSMGPGGVNRDNATLAIRGIHPTHYGRICPIETPEGKNTGLVNSMTTYAKINPYGMLQSPYYKVYKGFVLKNTGIFYLSAEQEEKIKLAAADIFVSQISCLPKALIPVRFAEDFTKIPRSQVQFIGVSTIQMISIATSLIPFLEHDDANRALMGSNMQRQAVPLIRTERPIVGTGLEARAVSDSGHVIIANKSGFVTHVSANKIVVFS